jgi:hypothetical protein
MALQLSLTSLQQDSCGEWVLTDNTGAYNVTTNLGGWGAPNLPINDGSVTFAELVISSYSDGAYTVMETIDIISTWEELTGLTSDPFDTGTTIANTIYTITSDILNIPDGVYQIVYRVGDGTTYDNSTIKSSVTYNIATYCNIECCIEQRLANVPTEYTCLTCSNSYLEITMTLWTLLQALKLAACTASLDKYVSILSTLQTACEQSGSDCCS